MAQNQEGYTARGKPRRYEAHSRVSPSFRAVTPRSEGWGLASASSSFSRTHLGKLAPEDAPLQPGPRTASSPPAASAAKARSTAAPGGQQKFPSRIQGGEVSNGFRAGTHQERPTKAGSGRGVRKIWSLPPPL